MPLLPSVRAALRERGQSVVLVGLMGAGKSTVGRRLAKALELPFVDSDDAIAEAAGCSIPDIFEMYGETIFRDLEQRVMTRVLSETPAIIATGGGAFIQPAVRRLILEQAISVWLRAELGVLTERVSRRRVRPLLERGDKREILAQLMHARYPIYAQAALTIDSEQENHAEVVKKIIAALDVYLREAL